MDLFQIEILFVEMGREIIQEILDLYSRQLENYMEMNCEIKVCSLTSFIV